jgi:hypothetical protein
LWWLIFPGICERGEDPVNTGGLQELLVFFDGFFVVNLWCFAGERGELTVAFRGSKIFHFFVVYFCPIPKVGLMRICP